LIKGIYEKIGDDTVHITELPVGTWTMPYTTYLESLMDGTDKNGKRTQSQIKDFTSLSTEVSVDFTVVFPKGKLTELINIKDDFGTDGVEKLLKLTTSVSTGNMHMFDANIRLKKYRSVREIIDEFYHIRLELYVKRKAFLVEQLQHKLLKLSNKAKYIQENLTGTVDLRKKTYTQVDELLTNRKYDKIEGDYKYLTKMPMDSVTNENVEHIMKDKDNAQHELDVLIKTSEQKIWLGELDILENKYGEFKTKREKIQLGSGSLKPKKKSKK
jgi:DNA topoisomerase-2